MTTEITTNKDFDFEVSSGWVAIPRKIQDEIFYTEYNKNNLKINEDF